MEDSVKNLAESGYVEQQNIISPSLEEIIEKGLENFGWTQFLQCILVSIAMYFDSQQLFMGIYTDNYPTWHCTNNTTTTCTSRSDLCKLPKSSWAWDGPSSKTIISHFGLECANSFITALPQSSFFVGCLLGSFILSSLADSSFGRKNMIILSCFSMSIISLIIVFSTNVWIYSTLKLLIGFFRSSIPTCGLVLLMERVSTKWRFTVGIMDFFFFTAGYITLPGVAYANRHSSWKYLYLWTSVPAICYCLIVYFFVTESPRWLLMQGRDQEAMAMLKGVPNNHANLSASLPNTQVKEDVSHQQELSLAEETSLPHSDEPKELSLSASLPNTQVKEDVSHQQELNLAEETSLPRSDESQELSLTEETSLPQSDKPQEFSLTEDINLPRSDEPRLEPSLEDGSQKMMTLRNKKKGGASFCQLYSSIGELFKTSWAPKRMLAVMGLGLGIGMVYFGLPLAVGNLNYNIYLAVVFSAMMEIPSGVVTYFLGNCSRKLSIFAFSIGSGVCCIVCAVIRNGPQSVKLCLAVASFFCACTAYNVFIIYIIELFPTSVRNTTGSLTRQAVVFGCVFSPLLISAGRKNNIFSYGVFGVIIICSTSMLWSLPETKGMPLSDTMDQQEKKEMSDKTNL